MRENGKYKIERGIPMPPSRGRNAHEHPLYKALAALKVGESFLAGPDPSRASTPHMLVLRYIQNMRTRHKSKSRFTTRAVEGGVRVWRVE